MKSISMATVREFVQRCVEAEGLDELKQVLDAERGEPNLPFDADIPEGHVPSGFFSLTVFAVSEHLKLTENGQSEAAELMGKAAKALACGHGLAAVDYINAAAKRGTKEKRIPFSWLYQKNRVAKVLADLGLTQYKI
jgi:hypothetical protein